jgi:hypothetical protein
VPRYDELVVVANGERLQAMTAIVTTCAFVSALAAGTAYARLTRHGAGVMRANSSRLQERAFAVRARDVGCWTDTLDPPPGTGSAA